MGNLVITLAKNEARSRTFVIKGEANTTRLPPITLIYLPY